MTILIAYATTEGQTRKIARFCAETLTATGQSVELLNVEDAGGLDLAGFAAVILAGSVHLGRVQAALLKFATDNARALSDMPVLYLQVSLSAAVIEDDAERAEIDAIADRFFVEAGWRPARIEHVAGAFKFTEYDFFKSLAMRWVAAQQGEKVDRRKDREYTDWDALRRVLDAWLAGLDSAAA